MVVLIASAMIGTTKIAQPHIQSMSNSGVVGHYKGIAEYIFLNEGTPTEWGKDRDEIPTLFGLASATQSPYELDLDKVTRLNGNNIFSVSYERMLAALGFKDMSLSIKIQSIFDLSINMTSKQSGLTETNYTFRIEASRAGYPVEARLRCYAVIDDYIVSVCSATDDEGTGSVEVTLPNSFNGAAVLVAFARAESHDQIAAWNAHAFGHNSESPKPNLTFAQLSPTNYVLNASYTYPSVNVTNAHVFTCDYNSAIFRIASGNQSDEYSIPRIIDASPMIIVLSGTNSSQTFAEWIGYPQIPLEAGPASANSSLQSTALAFTYIVSVDSVLYKASVTIQEVQS
jgi:hypothetical protein